MMPGLQGSVPPSALIHRLKRLIRVYLRRLLRVLPSCGCRPRGRKESMTHHISENNSMRSSRASARLPPSATDNITCCSIGREEGKPRLVNVIHVVRAPAARRLVNRIQHRLSRGGPCQRTRPLGSYTHRLCTCHAALAWCDPCIASSTGVMFPLLSAEALAPAARSALAACGGRRPGCPSQAGELETLAESGPVNAAGRSPRRGRSGRPSGGEYFRRCLRALRSEDAGARSTQA